MHVGDRVFAPDEASELRWKIALHALGRAGRGRQWRIARSVWGCARTGRREKGGALGRVEPEHIGELEGQLA
ncbi:MAG: hypothetical protein ACJ8CR_17915 [Roseiflexaceae bacterium]